MSTRMSRRSAYPLGLRGSRVDNALLAFLAVGAFTAYGALNYVFVKVAVWGP